MLPRSDNEGEERAADHRLYGRFEELRPDEMGRIMRECPLAYLPSGTLEWHADHLPLGLDGIVADELCLRAAQRSGGVVVPATYWAIGGVPYPYTMRMDPSIVEDLFVSIIEQLGHVGFRAVFIMAGHYGIDHYTALKRAAAHVMGRSDIVVAAVAEFELVTDRGFRGGDHAGAWETSLLWALRPDLVSMDHLSADGPVIGVIGEDPRPGASPERGRALADTLVERMALVGDRLVHDTAHLVRSAHLAALVAQVDILEQIRQDRATKPRAQVRDVMTEPYLRYLDHFWRGDYAEAGQAAAEARLALASSSER